MGWILFLDDMRHPAEVIPGDKLSAYHGAGHVVIWAKDADMAIWATEEWNELPEFIWFDHDLGAHLVPGGFKFMNITAMDYLHWLERETSYIQHYDPPEFMVHSGNPVGQGSILSFMESWEKSRRIVCDDCEGNGCNNCIPIQYQYNEE